ncbi:MAG: signal peptide peptidase SppA [Rhodobacteraceae bacterium]|nr:signal peptide peptidase SppA [Paracoccaceae bacterium]
MDALERDFYEERRRKWRRSAFWRGFFVALFLLIALGVALSLTGLETARDHVARVSIDGFIGESRERDEMLDEIAESDTARAVILRINSPGGTTAGAEALYAALRRVAAEKPVVAVMSEVAASGGYVAALGADHIVARGNSLTGSIGVIMEYPDLTRVMDRIGVEMETVRSSPLKAEPSPFRPTSPAAREVSEEMVADSYAWFRGLVAERRGLEGESLSDVTNGAVFTGRIALENGLVDEIGGETEAIAWLESREPELSDLPVVNWEREEQGPELARILGKLGASSGILGEISRWQGAKLYSIGP